MEAARELGKFLWWLLLESIPPATLLVILGFVFREKWKQVLARSLNEDTEKLRHTLQRDLESYKTSLIAQAEEVKLRSDVKRSIANRYVEQQFERLMGLEAAMSEASQLIQTSAAYPDNLRSDAQLTAALDAHSKFDGVWGKAEMFLTDGEHAALLDLNNTLTIFLAYIGPGRPVKELKSPEARELTRKRIVARNAIRTKLHSLAQV